MTYTDTEVLIEIRRTVKTFKHLKAAAYFLGVSNTFLHDVLNGKRPPGETIPRKLLGLERRMERVKNVDRPASCRCKGWCSW